MANAVEGMQMNTAKRDMIFAQTSHLCTVKLPNERSFRISQIAIDSGERMRFFHDARILKGESAGLYCGNHKDTEIIKSVDNGRHWHTVYKSPDSRRILRFHAASNCYVVQLDTPFETQIVSLSGERIRDCRGPKFPWHGSQGIGESDSGTIIFGEYQTGKSGVVLSLWRCDADLNFTPVLSKISGRFPPDGEIRHFHTCFPDPFESGVWYASSGDAEIHNKIWISEDDGCSWRELRVVFPSHLAFGIRSPVRMLRFTSAHVYDKRNLIWATDDGLGIDNSALVMAEIAKDEINVTLVGALGRNYSRNIIWSEDGFYMIVSESKNDPERISLNFHECFTRKLFRRDFPNLKGAPSPVTASFSSGHFVNGKAYLPSNGALFTRSNRGIIEISVEGREDFVR